MLSRVAESIYWMCRQVERAENVARYISVNLNLSLDMPGEDEQQWHPLVVTTGDNAKFAELYSTPTREAVIQFLTFDRANPNSIFSCLWNARENARSVREVISAEMWEHINKFYLMLKESSLQSALENPTDFFDAIRNSGQQFMGITDATMTHGEAWHFCRLGRSLERADKTSRILDVKYFILLPSSDYVGTPYDDIQWSALLRSASALEMYRQRFGRLTPKHIVEFLILDKEFPRAVLYCLANANQSLHMISGSAIGSFGNVAEQKLGRLHAELAFAKPNDIIDMGLHEFVDDLQSRLNKIGGSISEKFFALRPVKQNKAQKSGAIVASASKQKVAVESVEGR